MLSCLNSHITKGRNQELEKEMEKEMEQVRDEAGLVVGGCGLTIKKADRRRIDAFELWCW